MRSFRGLRRIFLRRSSRIRKILSHNGISSKRDYSRHMKKFDPTNSPLDGKNLIEAAAGTGKTYAVTCLFVRLIIEKTFSVRDILVVTFTVAATEELKDRIRKILKDALDSFTKARSDELFLNGLLEKYPDEADRKIAVE